MNLNDWTPPNRRNATGRFCCPGQPESSPHVILRNFSSVLLNEFRGDCDRCFERLRLIRVANSTVTPTSTWKASHQMRAIKISVFFGPTCLAVGLAISPPAFAAMNNDTGETLGGAKSSALAIGTAPTATARGTIAQTTTQIRARIACQQGKRVVGRSRVTLAASSAPS